MCDEPDWKQHGADLKVPAKPIGGYWTLVVPFVKPDTLVRIEAQSDEWHYTADRACGPDGVAASYISNASCLNTDAPVGALIGKIGGSTADTKGDLFVVGRYCVVKVKTDHEGPLFLTINDARAGFQDNTGEIQVTVSTSDCSKVKTEPE